MSQAKGTLGFIPALFIEADVVCALRELSVNACGTNTCLI